MAVNQTAIDRLKLDEAFVGKMIHRAFNECWTVKCDEKLTVVDDNSTKISRFGNDNDSTEHALVVFNDNRCEIVLLAIDNQLLKAIEGGVADCALFDDKQFRFVEFKTNAEGKSAKSQQKTFDKATNQLKNTIQVFKDSLQTVGVQFKDAVAVRCHVVVSSHFPKSHAVMQGYKYRFINEMGIDLNFSSETYWEESNK